MTGLDSAHDLANETPTGADEESRTAAGAARETAASMLARARTETFARHLTPVTLATVVAASLLVWTTRTHAHGLAGNVWWSVVVGFGALRLLWFRAYWRPQNVPNVRWLRTFGVSVFVSGMLWGASAFVFYVPSSELHQLLLAFLLGGLSSGAAASLGCHWPTYLLWVVPAVLPLTLRLILQGDPTHVFMAGTLALYIIAMGLVAHGTERAFAKNVGLAFEKQQLLDTLLVAQSELRHANMELDARIRASTRELRRVEQAHHAVEAERVHGRKLEAMGRLTGGVAHDFNNLLAVILNVLSQVKASVPAGSSADTLIGDAESAARRGARLTESLLAFSRTQRLKPVSVDLAQTLCDVQRGLLEPAVGRRIELEHSMPADLWPVMVDPDQLCVALLNLVVNAKDAMPEGGTIELSARNRRVERHPVVTPGDYVELVVEDQGTGMLAEVLDRAFEPFYTTKAVGAGSGLGLSMVYGFARQSQGDVMLDSEPGVGTRVKLLLPRAAEPGAAILSAAPPSLAPRGSGELILLVEDEPELRRVVNRVLTGLGYRVREARDAEAALELLSEPSSEVDLLLTDAMMPGRLDGFGLIHEARKLRAGLPIVLVSGFPETQHEGALGDLPASGLTFLKKPFDPSRLAQALRHLLENRNA